jgi:hypothetical protein
MTVMLGQAGTLEAALAAASDCHVVLFGRHDPDESCQTSNHPDGW